MSISVLFAADHTDQSTPAHLPGLDDPIEEAVEGTVYRLVEHYKRSLKLEIIRELRVVKPDYDLESFTLIQPVNKLESNRELVWTEHYLSLGE